MTFTVADTEFPVAATVVGDPVVLSLEVFDSAGNPVGGPAAGVNTGGDRQHQITFMPPAPGQYRFRAVVPPTGSLALDISHGTEIP